jgi:hypothetical protein
MSLLLPTRSNAAVLFLDMQEGIVPNGRTMPLERLRARAVALAQLRDEIALLERKRST